MFGYRVKMPLELVAVMTLVCLYEGGLTSGLEIGGSGYGAVVDAGSSGSRVYIYKWNPHEWTRQSLPDIDLHFTYKVKPGLSSYANNLSDVRIHVQELLTKIKNNVPEHAQEETPLLFMATAGLRLLSESNALAVIEEVEHLLDDATINPFWHDASSIRILSGEGEGTFSWLATNYLNGYFNEQSSPSTKGVLEMGGASSQITFLPEVDPLADKFPVQVLGQDYSLYTHSYLGYGQEAVVRWIEETIAARHPGKRLLQSPCMLKGDYKEVVTDANQQLIFFGTGEPESCDRLIEEYFTMEPAGSCKPKPCGMGAVYQPSIPDNMQLFAVSSYYLVARDIQLISRDVKQAYLRPIQYKQKAFEFCAREYTDVAEEVGDNPYISLSCSSALAIYKLLTIGFGLSDNTANLHVVDTVHGEEISWTLGALIYEMEKIKCSTGVDKSRIIQLLGEVVNRLRNE